jgi:hypothetical protein
VAVVREGVGDAGQVGLVHLFGDRVVESLGLWTSAAAKVGVHVWGVRPLTGPVKTLFDFVDHVPVS